MSNARFYDRATLRVLEEVPMATPKKLPDGTMKTMRKPTITDARKLGALVSVTSVIEDTFATSHNLIEWKQEQVMEACMSFPFIPSGEITEDVRESYKAMIWAKSEEYTNLTADKGNEIHGAVKEWIRKKIKPDDPICSKIVWNLEGYLKKFNISSMNSEETICTKEIGFAGTPDLVVHLADGTRMIMDYKSTSFKKFTKPYEKWKLQLGGYRILTKSMPGTQLIQAVFDRDHGDALFLPQEDPDVWAEAFAHLFETWVRVNKYDPRKKECTISETYA